MQTKPIVLSQEQIALTAFAGNEKHGSAYTSLAVTGQVVEATDGHIAVRVQHGGVSADDFPVNPAIPQLSGPNGKPILLSVESVKSGTRCADRKSSLPVLRCAIVGLDGEGAGVIASTDLESTSVGRTEQSGPAFPNLDKVIPPAEGKIRVGLNARYLKALADYALKQGDGTVVFYFDGEHAAENACRVEVGLKEGRGKLIGALMPMRV